MGDAVVEDKKEDSEKAEAELKRYDSLVSLECFIRPPSLNGKLTCCSTQTTGTGAPIVVVAKLIAHIT